MPVSDTVPPDSIDAAVVGSSDRPTPPRGRHRMITYPFCLRREPEEVWAELRLPSDMTTAEAERVAAYVRALALAAEEGGR